VKGELEAWSPNEAKNSNNTNSYRVQKVNSTTGLEAKNVANNGTMYRKSSTIGTHCKNYSKFTSVKVHSQQMHWVAVRRRVVSHITDNNIVKAKSRVGIGGVRCSETTKGLLITCLIVWYSVTWRSIQHFDNHYNSNQTGQNQMMNIQISNWIGDIASSCFAPYRVQLCHQHKNIHQIHWLAYTADNADTVCSEDSHPSAAAYNSTAHKFYK